MKACQDTARSQLAAITSVIVCKHIAQQPFPGGGLAYISRPDPMYLWAVRLLLERVSWFIRDYGGGSSVVTFAHLTRFKGQKLHDYRRALWHSATEIDWASFDGHDFRVDHPRRIELLQVADIAASAVFKAVEPDRYGNTEPRYLTEMASALYRHPPGHVTSYGLKAFPTGQGTPAAACITCGSSKPPARSAARRPRRRWRSAPVRWPPNPPGRTSAPS